MKLKTSTVWNYFVKIDDSLVRCELCDKVCSRKGGTTNALKSHLKAIHAEEFAEFQKLDKAVKLSSETKKKANDETAEYSQNSENEQTEYNYSEEENDENDDDNMQDDIKHEELDPLKAYEITVNEASGSITKKRKIYKLDSANNTLKLVRDGDDDLEPILKIENGPKIRKKAIKRMTNEFNTQIDDYAGVTTAQPRGGVHDKHDDEYDTFGKHVAHQLRKLSTMKYILAQEEIQSTITKFRMGDFDG